MRFYLGVLIVVASSGCKPGHYTASRLAVDGSSESQFMSDACSQHRTVARYSRLRIGARDVLIMTKDLCASKHATRQVSYGLVGESLPRKPVMIIDGYGGNTKSNEMVHTAVSDTQPWANENFRVVNIPAGASVDVAQKLISEDRRKNPQDYGPDSWVGLIQAAHGYVGDDGRHRTVKSDVTHHANPTNHFESAEIHTSYLTTDRAGALIEGIGHNAGTVSCLFYQCQSGQVRQDPDFERLQSSQVNPEQKRIFQFSSAPDRMARVSPSIGEDGQIHAATPIEQTVGFLMQQAEGDGLTVAEFQSKLKRANLGDVVGLVEVETGFVPNLLQPLGGPSDFVGRPKLSPLFAPQLPSVVGPKDAFILPPGIVPDRHNPPIATRDDQIRSMTNEVGDGAVFGSPIDVGAGPYEQNVPDANENSPKSKNFSNKK